MELLEIGRIVRFHGLAGRMKVLSHLESPAVLHDLPEVFVGLSVQEAMPFPLEAVQNGKDFFILKLKGIEDRDAAAKLVGSTVWISSEGRKKLREGEYYWGRSSGFRLLRKTIRSSAGLKPCSLRGAMTSMSAGEGKGRSCCPPSSM